MKYELKFIHPLPLLINASRVLVILGFILSILTFFVFPNPNLAVAAWWQKILGALIFTVVYTIVVSLVVTLVSVLYNFFAGKFKGVTFYLEQSE